MYKWTESFDFYLPEEFVFDEWMSVRVELDGYCERDEHCHLAVKSKSALTRHGSNSITLLDMVVIFVWDDLWEAVSRDACMSANPNEQKQLFHLAELCQQNVRAA